MMSAVLQLWKIHNPKQKKAEKSGICANDHLGVQCTGQATAEKIIVMMESILMTLSHYLCVIVILLGHFSSFTYGNNMSYTLDVLCCQPIKLIQAVSASEFHEY